jgi:hypothetical protein
MTEVTLEFIGQQLEKILKEQKETRLEIREIKAMQKMMLLILNDHEVRLLDLERK